MNHYDLNTGEREMGGGLERYTFQLPLSFFTSMPEGADIKQRIVGVYCASPRPDPREIVGVQMRPDGKTAHVTLTIQRGHYMLARLVMEHEELTFNKAEGFAMCKCCNARHPLVPSSIPDYGKEL